MNALLFYWWGMKLFVDDARTQEIIQILHAGGSAAAVSGVLAAIGIGAPLALIGGIVWLAAFAIANANASRRGVVFTMTWFGLPWCWSQ